MRALGFFERPGRKTDLIALAGRLSAFVPPQPEAEIGRLRQKLASSPEKPVPSHFSFRRPGRRVVIAAGLIGALLASVGLVAVAGRNSARLALTSAFTRALGGAENKLLHVFSSRQAPASSATGVAPSAPVRESATARRVRPFAPKRAASVSEPPPATVLSETTAATNGPGEGFAGVHPLPLERSRESFVLLAPLANLAIVTTGDSSSDTVGGEPVYSRADTDVRPPALLRPQLPTLPAPTAHTSYYEILVDENGAAASVKLVSPVRRYYDGMLVAAAKAWTFTPAVRDGRPVKYWIRVPINVAEGWH
jgi:hypothetical protein